MCVPVTPLRLRCQVPQSFGPPPSLKRRSPKGLLLSSPPARLVHWRYPRVLCLSVVRVCQSIHAPSNGQTVSHCKGNTPLFFCASIIPRKITSPPTRCAMTSRSSPRARSERCRNLKLGNRKWNMRMSKCKNSKFGFEKEQFYVSNIYFKHK